ncbi:MAG: hypothetical protein NVS3B21_17900 [Acidimicrobiales bacterium]
MGTGIRSRVERRRGWWPVTLPLECIDHFAQRPGTVDDPITGESRLARPVERHHDRPGAHRIDESEDARDPPNRPVQAELTDEGTAVDARWSEPSLGHQDADGDREIEAGAHFSQGGGGEVDGHTGAGEFEPGRRERRSHAIPGFATRRVGQADDGERRKPAPDVHFDGDRPAVDAEKCGGWDRGDHGDLRCAGSYTAERPRLTPAPRRRPPTLRTVGDI